MPNRDDSDAQLDRDLARLARATDPLTPDDRFTDALVEGPLRAAARASGPLAAAASPPAAGPDALLARAARATADLAPAGAFTEAVLSAAGAAPAPLAEGLTRTGPLAVMLAAVAAAACVFFSAATQHEVDASIVASVDAVEVSE